MAREVFALKAKPLVVITLLLDSKWFFTFGMRSSRNKTRSRWWFHETNFIALFFTHSARSLLSCDIGYAPSDLIEKCEWLRSFEKLWGNNKVGPGFHFESSILKGKYLRCKINVISRKT